MSRKKQILQQLDHIKGLLYQENLIESNNVNSLLSQLVQPIQDGEDYLSSNEDEDSEGEISEEEKEIYNGIHAEYDDLTSGYSTISSNKGEYTNIRRPVNSLLQQQAASSTLNRLSLL